LRVLENTRPIWQTRGLIMKPIQDAKPVTPAQDPAPEPKAAEPVSARPSPPALPREIGGRDGPEPTRFGDWEKAGRCIDF
jgi:hypothetical protein